MLGLLIVVPVVAFGIAHIRNAYNRPNRRAVYVGYALFTAALILLASGIVLTRLEGIIVVKDPTTRSIASSGALPAAGSPVSSPADHRPLAAASHHPLPLRRRSARIFRVGAA